MPYKKWFSTVFMFKVKPWMLWKELNGKTVLGEKWLITYLCICHEKPNQRIHSILTTKLSSITVLCYF